MPVPFTRCIKQGGRIVTIKPTSGTYKKICYPPGGGKGKAGETHHNKKRGRG